MVKNDKDLKLIFKIRKIVFLKEQKITPRLEFDKFDKLGKNVEHIIASYENKPVGCARIRFLGNKAKLERIAILKGFRSRGFGKSLLIFMINYSKHKTAKLIIMDAQYYAVGFYKKLGFKSNGKPYMEAGIKHIDMHMKTG